MIIKLITTLIFQLITLNSYAQLSYGDGSESCNWVTDNKSQRIYNCDSVTIGTAQTITFNSASDYIIIRSQGDVNIIGDINISANGVTKGPGGGAPGTCPALGTCSGVDGVSKNGGQGIGGTTGVTGGSGGGGSGGRFGSLSLPSAGTDGDDANTGGTRGSGAAIPTSGYFPASSFETSFSGGAGGGAGGSGVDGITTIEDGGAGGAGGGGLIIIAKGSVNISGNILANGGNANNGSDGNGGQAGGAGGGGGSGGAIYIIGKLGVTISTGSLSAVGGTGGTGGAGGVVLDIGGNGGNGGAGAIRIDTPSGVYSGAATNPVSYQSILPTIIDPVSSTNINLDSDIDYSCVYKGSESEIEYSFIFNFVLGVLLLGIPMVFRRRQY